MARAGEVGSTAHELARVVVVGTHTPGTAVAEGNFVAVVADTPAPARGAVSVASSAVGRIPPVGGADLARTGSPRSLGSPPVHGTLESVVGGSSCLPVLARAISHPYFARARCRIVALVSGWRRMCSTPSLAYHFPPHRRRAQCSRPKHERPHLPSVGRHGQRTC